MNEISTDSGALIAVSAALGAGATAIARMVSGNRRTDKVDAVTAVAAAFDRVAERTNRHVDDLSANLARVQDRCDYLERELRKRDEMILKYLADATLAAASATKESIAATLAASDASTAATLAAHTDIKA